jgi:hypothetical protein
LLCRVRPALQAIVDFTVINETDEPIARATIVVCGQTIEMREIPVAGRVSGTYRAKADGDYAVSVQFADGKQLHSRIGYVTNGVRYADEDPTFQS